MENKSGRPQSKDIPIRADDKIHFVKVTITFKKVLDVQKFVDVKKMGVTAGLNTFMRAVRFVHRLSNSSAGCSISLRRSRHRRRRRFCRRRRRLEQIVLIEQLCLIEKFFLIEYLGLFIIE